MTSNKNAVWRDVPIDNLGLSASVSKALAEANRNTAGDAADHPDLSKVPGIGPPSKKAILKAIEEIKIELAEEFDESDDQSAKASEPSNDPTGLTVEELIDKTDDEMAAERLEEISETVLSETDDELLRLLAKAKMDNDYEVQQVVDKEIGRRFEEKRKTQMQFELGLPFSDLNRRGYSTAEEGCRRYVNDKRYRISHEASVALARVYLAMKEGGVKLKSGRRVTHQRHVVEKMLELSYAEMKETESQE